MDLDRLRLLPLLPPPPAPWPASTERPCIMTSVHAIGHREGLEVALDGDGQRGFVDVKVHGVQETMARQQRSCRLNTAGRGMVSGDEGSGCEEVRGGSWWQLTISRSDGHK